MRPASGMLPCAEPRPAKQTARSLAANSSHPQLSIASRIDRNPTQKPGTAEGAAIICPNALRGTRFSEWSLRQTLRGHPPASKQLPYDLLSYICAILKLCAEYMRCQRSRGSTIRNLALAALADALAREATRRSPGFAGIGPARGVRHNKRSALEQRRHPAVRICRDDHRFTALHVRIRHCEPDRDRVTGFDAQELVSGWLTIRILVTRSTRTEIMIDAA